MSGIAGIFRLDGHDVGRQDLTQMTELMRHRGTDGIHHYVQGKIGLGQCTIHTTPQSHEAQLPLATDDGQLIVVMDGWVDNWAELRKTLLDKRCKLRNHSDAELVLMSYRLWGINCFERIDGECSIAIWDAEQSRLVCARDRSSKKPFYFYADGSCFVFASEMRSLLSLPWVDATLNENLIAEKLSDTHYSLRETCWKSVFRLPQAHHMVVDRQGPQTHRYWFPEDLPIIRYKKQSEYAEHYREVFLQTIKRFTRSDKPVSFEVSGGLDSSSVFASAAHHERAGALNAPSMHGYTLGFHDDGIANELEYAQSVADFLGKSVERITPAYTSLEEAKRFAIEHNTFPVAPNGFMHGDIYRHLQNLGRSVLITGMGGDDWSWACNNGYTEYMRLRDWTGLLDSLSNDVSQSGYLRTLYAFARQGLVPFLPQNLRSQLTRIKRKPQPNPFRDFPTSQRMDKIVRQQKQLLDTEPYGVARRLKKMNILFDPTVRFANETMEHFAALSGIELRAPFDSKAIIEMSFMIPEGRKRRSKLDRDLHRQAMQGLLPEKVQYRDNKANFLQTFDNHGSALRASSLWQDKIIKADWVKQADFEALISGLGQKNETPADQYVIWCLFSCACMLHT